MTNIEECNIDVTARNDQNINCELEGTVNMKLQGVATVKFTEVLYVPQEVNNILSVSRIVSKGAMMRDTQEKMTIQKTAST